MHLTFQIQNMGENYLIAFAEVLNAYTANFSLTDELRKEGLLTNPMEPNILQVARHLALGVSIDNAAPVQLCSIFGHLKKEIDDEKKQISPEKPKFFPFKPLDLTPEGTLPSDDSGDFTLSSRAFQAEFRKMNKKIPLDIWQDTFLFLCKKHFANIGAGPEAAWISAYEYAKTTAALYDSILRSEKGDLLLVGIGLDGIQSFCYDIVSSKAAKSMKGRSFYLQMLLDGVIQEIVCHPDIQACMGHVLYARGGKAYLILPKDPLGDKALDDIRLKVHRKLWEEHENGLFLFFEQQSFPIETENQVVIWEEIEQKIRRAKNRKHRLAVQFAAMEEGFDAGDVRNTDTQFCRVTGKTLKIGGSKHAMDYQLDAKNLDEDPVWVSKLVKAQVKIGEHLANATQYVQVRFPKAKKAKPGWLDVINDASFLGLGEEGENVLSVWANDAPSSVFVRTLNHTNFLDNTLGALSQGFAFYGGAKQATINGRLKEYSELAGVMGEDDKHTGFHRLGVARMDIDSLGILVREAQKSFAANATLSLQLDIFLSGYINTIRDASSLYRDFLNILFSGGDDMLIVGRWDVVLSFLEDVRNDFRAFIGGEDHCTMSAGLVLVTPKFPISKATEMAGEAEDAAKDFNGGKKDAICLFGIPIAWKDEFAFVKYLAGQLETWLNDEKTGVSAGLLQKIHQFRRLQASQRHDWRWQSAWFFQRLEKEEQRSKDIFYALKVFTLSGGWEFKGSKTYTLSSQRALTLLSVAARWAELGIRAKGNKIN